MSKTKTSLDVDYTEVITHLSKTVKVHKLKSALELLIEFELRKHGYENVERVFVEQRLRWLIGADFPSVEIYGSWSEDDHLDFDPEFEELPPPIEEVRKILIACFEKAGVNFSGVVDIEILVWEWG